MNSPNISQEELRKRWEAAIEREAEDKLSKTKQRSFSKERFDWGSSTSPMSKLQGYILISLALFILLLLGWSILRPHPKYEYKVVGVQAQFLKNSTERLNEIGPTEIGIKDDELTVLGLEGWELVDTILEIETTHPNYGNSSYVTGLQPNVRPQRALLIFRRISN
jgi:hypothetical protein